ncbi:hypothetical protein LCGC14_1423180 [marine sediment metagenome]|uniref:Uncharacterized protein n=1 Tax=marine sediment metagenome TaxID=412755 RepID=A0A0F9MSF8_9ZZZZ
MTLTEATNYMAQVYIEEGRLTERRWRKIKRESLIMSILLILVIITPALLILISFLGGNQ